MSSPAEISAAGMQPDATWNATLRAAAQEVFSLMVGVELSPSESPDSADGLHVTAMVGMAGQLCGVFSVCCSGPVAGVIASRMLGLSDEEAKAHSGDAIGEICNMVAGAFKSKIPGLEDKCMLSVPTVITGDHYTMHSLVVSNHLELVMLFEGNPVKFTLEVRS
jgi:CheY-specific phosphatase CheX